MITRLSSSGERGAGAAEIDGARNQTIGTRAKAGGPRQKQGQGGEGAGVDQERIGGDGERERSRDLESLPSLRRLRRQVAAGGSERAVSHGEGAERVDGTGGVVESWGWQGLLDKSSSQLALGEGEWAGEGAGGEAENCHKNMPSIHRLQPPNTHSLQEEAQGAGWAEAGERGQVGNGEGEGKKWAGQARELTIDLYDHGERERGGGKAESPADVAGAVKREGGESPRVSSRDEISAGTGGERRAEGGQGEGKVGRGNGFLRQRGGVDVGEEEDEDEAMGGQGQEGSMWQLGGLDAVDRMIAREIKRVQSERARNRSRAGDTSCLGSEARGFGCRGQNIVY